jgi:hypothetical protein
MGKAMSLYRQVKWQNHRGQRIPVGMPSSIWAAKFEEEQFEAQIRHARWAAKQLARWALKRDAVSLLDSSIWRREWLSHLGVAEELLDSTSAVAKKWALLWRAEKLPLRDPAPAKQLENSKFTKRVLTEQSTCQKL